MRRIGIIALALGGCGGQIGTEDGFGCLVDATEAIGDTAATPDGFSESVDAMLARVTGTFLGTLTRTDSSTEDLELGVVQAGDPEVERRVWKSEGGSDGMEPAIGTDCLDDVRVPVTITLRAGTALDETLDADVLVDTEGTGAFTLRVALDDLQGDASPSGFDPADMAATSFHVLASIQASGWSGSMSFTGESHPTSDGPDGSVSATNDPWGDFTASKGAE